MNGMICPYAMGYDQNNLDNLSCEVLERHDRFVERIGLLRWLWRSLRGRYRCPYEGILPLGVRDVLPCERFGMIQSNVCTRKEIHKEGNK